MVLTLEQEIASIMRFALALAGNPQPYYYNVPEDFHVPAMFFPVPEISSDGETFETYGLDYSWYINVFHSTTEEAYKIANDVLNGIRGARNLIPLIKADGTKDTGGVRIKDPRLRKVEDGAVQLVIEWRSRKPYNDPAAIKMQSYVIENWYEQDTVEAAFRAAIENANDGNPHNEQTGEGPGE